MWDTFIAEALKWATGQWQIIMSAPYSFFGLEFICGIILTVVAWRIIDMLYGERFSIKDATIEHQGTLISDYREKLQGASPDEAASKMGALAQEVRVLTAKMK